MSERAVTWTCPSCGSQVGLSEALTSHEGLTGPDVRDRVAHALCGCYMLTMSNASLARLVSALLEASDNDVATSRAGRVRPRDHHA